MTVGRQLASARLQHQWSQQEIAERLQENVELIAAVENTDVGRLPDRTYVSDVVWEYAREVGLDPLQTERRYLAELDASDNPNAAVLHASRDSPDRQNDDVLWSAPLRPDGVDMPSLRLRRRRSGLRVASGAAVSLILIVAAIVYLGRVNTSEGVAEISRFVERQADEPPVDPDHSSSAVEPPAQDPRAGEPVHTGLARGGTPEASDGEHSSTARAPLTSPMSRAAGASSPVSPPVAPAPAGDPAATHAPDVSGPWHLTNRVESAAYSKYRNMTLGFQLTLEQRGTQIVGEGYKSSENGKPLAARRRTPIALEGRLEGERLVLNFTERGAARTSSGRVVLQVIEDGSLRGRFSSNAARSSGSSIAIR